MCGVESIDMQRLSGWGQRLSLFLIFVFCLKESYTKRKANMLYREARGQKQKKDNII
jgi:hypothetical protein